MSDATQPPQMISEGAAENERKLIAPAWHTVVLVLFLLLYSAAGYFTSRRFLGTGHGAGAPPPLKMLPTYGLTLIFEWVLFFYVYWGERRYSGRTLRESIGGRWAKAVDVWRDIGLAFSIWVVLLVVEGTSNHLLKPKGGEVLLKLLPTVWWQLIPWTLISASAGICEEYVFRGYLMEQFKRWTGIAWLAIVLQALIFGLGHGYQGLALMFAVFLLGLVFGITAHALKSLRANMIAHGWTDFFSGVAIYLVRAFHLMPGM